MAPIAQNVRSCVKEAVLTAEHPGYRFEFFRSYAEFDAYFRELCGADWRTQPWAVFWFNDTRREVDDGEMAQKKQLPLEFATNVQDKNTKPYH